MDLACCPSCSAPAVLVVDVLADLLASHCGWSCIWSRLQPRARREVLWFEHLRSRPRLGHVDGAAAEPVIADRSRRQSIRRETSGGSSAQIEQARGARANGRMARVDRLHVDILSARRAGTRQHLP